MSSRRDRAAARRKQKTFTSVLFIGGSILLIAALAYLFSGSSAGQTTGPARIGQALGDFSLQDIHGKTVRLSDYAGKTILVNAWATWCPPCKAEMPDLNDYYQAHQAEGFVILAVNAGDPASAASEFASSNSLAFPVLLDPNLALLDSMNIHDFPTSILIGSDGIVKSVHIGMYTPQALDQEVTPYLK